MSVVTALIMTCAIGDEDEEGNDHPDETMIEVNKWLAEKGFAILKDKSELSDGGKHPQICIFMAGYNHFPIEEFVEFFNTLEWYTAQETTLMIKRTDDPELHLFIQAEKEKI